MSIDVGKAIGYLDLDTSGFQKGFKSALQDLRAFNDDSATATTKIGALGSAFKDVGSAMTKNVTVPIAGAGAAVTTVAAKFESAMSRVGAISGATGDDFTALREKAKELGATTVYSASEVADGMTEMAKAGWDSQQIIDGMAGVLNAASASGESLANVSTIVADAITGFGLEAADATRVADLLTQAANAGTIDIGDLGESFKYISPVAQTMGFSIEDVTTALSAMSMAGIKGSQAGTSLRTMLTRMVKPTDAVQGAMDDLGIVLANSDGTFKSLDQILSEMRVTFSGLSDEQKTYYATVLSGQEGMSGLLSILGLTQQEYDAIAESMANATGTAEATAETMLDNLGGQLTILKSTLEGVAISFGDILLPAIKKVVSGLQDFLTWLNGLSDGQKELVVTITAIVAAIGPVLLIIGKIITSVTSIITVVNKLKPAMAALNAVMVANPIGVVVVAIAGLVAALVTLYNKNESFRNFVNEAWSQIKSVISGVVDGIVNFFTITIPEAINSVIEWFQTLVDKITEFFTVTIPEKIDELVQWFTELPERIGYAIGFAIGTVARWVVDLATEAAEVAPKVIDAVVNFFSELPGKVEAWLTQTLTNFANWVTQTKEKAMTVGAEIIETVVNFFRELPGKIQTTLLDAIEKVKQWGSDIISWAEEKIPEVINTITSFFEELPGKMLEIGKNLLLGLAEGISSAVGTVVSKVKSVASSVLSGFKDAFGIHSPSRETAEMGNMLMQGLAGGVSDSSNVALSAVMEMASMLTTKLESLVTSLVQLMNFAGNAIQPFGIGDEEDQQNMIIYTQQVAALTVQEQEQTVVVTILNQAYQALVELLKTLLELGKELKDLLESLIDTGAELITSLEEQASAYDKVTESIEKQIEALKSLQALQSAVSAAKTISTSESALKASSSGSSSKGYSFDYSKSGSGWTEAEMREGFITDTSSSKSASTTTNNTYVFNSPVAVTPTVAAKQLKQTAQQLSMSIT